MYQPVEGWESPATRTPAIQHAIRARKTPAKNLLLPRGMHFYDRLSPLTGYLMNRPGWRLWRFSQIWVYRLPVFENVHRFIPGEFIVSYPEAGGGRICDSGAGVCRAVSEDGGTADKGRKGGVPGVSREDGGILEGIPLRVSYSNIQF